MVYYSHSLVVADPDATSKYNPSCKQGCNATIRCFPYQKALQRLGFEMRRQSRKG
jgi:hypothetical protein